MNKTFWVGTYPGLTNEMVDFVAESIAEYVNKG
jgi:CDP-6-deoxy-D-xylo-4-hexulose-3-dehydrase